jgi:hypothetical protein
MRWPDYAAYLNSLCQRTKKIRLVYGVGIVGAVGSDHALTELNSMGKTGCS